MVEYTEDEGVTGINESIQSEDTSLLPIKERRSNVGLRLQTLFFAILSIFCQVGQSVTLPLWIDSGNRHGTITTLNITTNSGQFKPFMDDYFILIFAAFSFTLVFGIALAVKVVIYMVQKSGSGRSFDRRISHKQVLLVGVLCGFASTLIVYPSSGKRTAPYLQAILVNISIPATLILRFLLLKKAPTKRKFICAMTTVFSLFVCLLPSIFPKIDPKHGKNKEQGGAKGLAGVLWPLCYMLGFVVSALANVIQENLLQFQHSLSKMKVDMLYLLFLIQITQFLLLLVLFWMDAIPIFGNVDNIQKVALNCLFGVRCLFGHAGCSFYPGLYGFLFILLYSVFIISTMNLLRYSEGATFLAIISAVSTPVGFLFWTLFKEQPSFHWHPEVSNTVWLNIAGLLVMVPSVYLYNTGEDKDKLKSNRLAERRPLL